MPRHSRSHRPVARLQMVASSVRIGGVACLSSIWRTPLPFRPPLASMQRFVRFTASLSVAFFSLCVCDPLPAENPTLPPIRFQRWSGSINVPDPVAISVDHQGRVFVTQTRRRKIQDLDIRQHGQWVPDDVGLASVSDKRAFLRQQLAIGGDSSAQSKHVDDHNGDGKHDWRDLTVVSECIYRLVDTDGSGTADEITVFAEDFKTEVTGIAAGVMAFRRDVWATIAPDVWRLTDTNDDGVADQREIVVTGFGLHIAYAGHDMHGLTVGPDGKVYWSIGDKGIHVTADDGTPIAFPNQGGVMRCNPDGSQFEVFAHGLRNVQEIAFDQFGNLFGVDNDADKPGERERFVWIVPGMDAGWRCNYQYRGDDYNPWTDERLWELPGEEHPAYIVPPLAHYIDGPAGFKFNPGTALSPSYKNFFFITGAPNGNQHAFRTEPTGDAFAMVDEHKIGSGTAIVGLTFGPDGALYGADWDGGYPLDQKGAVIRMDVPENDRSSERPSVQRLLAEGVSKRTEGELTDLLAHPDQRVRLEAQFSLAERNAVTELKDVATNVDANQLARVHAIWGLGQIARQGESSAVTALVRLRRDADPIIRSQFAKTYGNIDENDVAHLTELLTDEDLHVRVHAGLALSRDGDSNAVATLLKQADRLGTDQHYLRHSIVSALAASADVQSLVAQTTHPSQMRRLCAVLALRHQRAPAVSAYLGDESNWVAIEAARAIHDDQSIAGAMPALAQALSDSGDRGEAFTRRAVNANFRIGSEQSAERVMRFASDRSRPVAARVDALDALAHWKTPPTLDRVDGRNRKSSKVERSIPAEVVQASLAELASGRKVPVQIAAVIAARKLALTLSESALLSLVKNNKLPADLRVESLNALAESKPSVPDGLFAELTKSRETKLAVRAIELLTERDAESAMGVLQASIASESLPLRQASVAGMARLTSPSADQALQSLADRAIAGDLESDLMLDVVEALRARSGESVSLKDHALLVEQGRVDAMEEGLKRFTLSRDGGDPVAGETLFRTHGQAQCTRCHRIGRRGSNIGPELTKIATKRDADYLLRSIVLPNVDIEPKFLVQTILLDSGQVVKGVITREDEKETIVVTGEAKELKIETDSIEAVASQKVSLMPDVKEFLSPRQVRDLVAFLRTLK